MLLFYVSTFKAPFPLPEFWPDEIWVSNAASDDGAQHQYCFLQRVSNWNSWESILSIWNENLDLLWVIHARMNFWSGTWLHMGANCKNSFTSTDLLFLSSALHTHNFFLQSEGSRTAPRRIGAETIRTVKRVGMKLSSSKREEKTSKEITFHLDFFKLV